MNKIYKVVWSKVKNCYVVVSELAKNVITGSVKSAKVGAAPMVKGLALSAVMAFVITGNALAADLPTDGSVVQPGNYTVNTDTIVNGSVQTMIGKASDRGAVLPDNERVNIVVEDNKILTIKSTGLNIGNDIIGVVANTDINYISQNGEYVGTKQGEVVLEADGGYGNAVLGHRSQDRIAADTITLRGVGGDVYGIYSDQTTDVHELIADKIDISAQARTVYQNNGVTNMTANEVSISSDRSWENKTNWAITVNGTDAEVGIKTDKLVLNGGIDMSAGTLALSSVVSDSIDTIQITGNVQATSGTLTGLSLTGSDSFIEGAINTNGNENATVSFSNGATFNANDKSELETFGGSGGVIALDQSLLDTANAVTIAKNTSEGTTVKVKDLSLKGGTKEALSGLEEKLQSAVVVEDGNALKYEASAVDVALRGDVELKNGKVTTTMDTDDLVVTGDVKAGNVSLVDTAKAVAGKVDAGKVVPDDRWNMAIASLAVGKDSVANVGGNTGFSTAVGVAAKASALSTAIGSNAEATADNSVAIGAASVADEYGTFSVGSEENKRRIVNVADGKDDYDAVNVGQLNAATANTKGISRTQYDGTTTGETKVTDDFVVDTKEGKGSFTMGYIYDEVANETNEMFIAKKLNDDDSYSTTMLINAQNGEIWTAASVTADAGVNAGKKANGTYAFSANANGAAVNGTLTTTGNTSLANGVLTATYVEGGVHEVSVQGNQKVTGGVAVGGAVAAQGDVTAGVNEKGEGGVSLLKTAADLSKLNDDVIKTNETLKTTNDNLTKLNGDVERIDAQVTENTEAIAAETEARKKDIVNVTDHINTVSTNVTEHVNAVQKDLSAAIQAETAAREEHVNAVQKDLSAAINANSAAIESNAAAIEANSQAIAIETAERKADIQNVTNHINTVQKDLSAAIDNVSANVTSHVNAVQKDLSAAINAETAAREEHVNAVQKDLSAAIQENSQAIATETEARKADVANVTSHVNAVQKDLSNAIQAETAAREEHVNAVQKDLSSAIQAETAAREEHVNAVQKDLSSAIQENTAAISAEEQARIAGDEANAAAISNNAEAISGLNQRLGKMNGKINKVGAGAAALAALHPLDYDPDDKLTFSAGVGNYAGENAMALGAFYRPDEKLMFSLGGTMGNGENMVNLGVSIGLDGAKGTPKLSKKELVQKVSTMEAENQAIKAENEALEERVAKLEALVAKLAEK